VCVSQSKTLHGGGGDGGQVLSTALRYDTVDLRALKS